jgi:hypothetical protein
VLVVRRLHDSDEEAAVAQANNSGQDASETVHHVILP